MTNDDLQRAANELVAGYKLAGVSLPDIAALLVFALEAVVRDTQTPAETIALLRTGFTR